MAETVRIEASAHATLSAIARAKRLSLTEALSRAIESYRREVFVADLAKDFAGLREDPALWAAELAERAIWDRSSADELPPEESGLAHRAGNRRGVDKSQGGAAKARSKKRR